MSREIESGEIKRRKMSDEVYSYDDKHMSEVEFLKSQLLDLLECPICLEIPRRGPIYGCKNGHMLCNDCKPKVVECPTCRDRELSSRSLVGEKMLDKVIRNYPLKCKFSTQYGCTVKGLLSNIENHEIYDCKYRTVKCPKNDKCGWNGPLARLIQHINKDKCASVLSPLSSNSLFINQISLFTKENRSIFSMTDNYSWHPSLLKTQDLLNNFCVLNISRDGNGNWMVYVKSISQVRNTMRVEIRAQNPLQTRDNFIYTGEVSLSSDTEVEIVDKGNFLMLRDSQVRKLIVEMDLDLRIRIFMNDTDIIG